MYSMHKKCHAHDSGGYIYTTVTLCEIDTSKMYNMYKKCITEDIITMTLCEIHTSTLCHCVRQIHVICIVCIIHDIYK